MTPRTIITATVIAAAIPILGTGIAFGHADVKKRYPAPGQTVSTTTKTVRITFEESVLTGKIVSIKSHHGAASFRSSINGAKTVITAKLTSKLKDGTTVKWRLKDDDGHTQTGRWSFKVA